jgi:NADPH:quinone reductase-like Zn-dependent oxidoreductase
MTADGAAAESVVAPAEILVPAPTSVPLPDAAALPMVGLAAWQALFDDAGLTTGQRLLINGAGGAVGGYAVQLAKHTDAYVIATASPRSSDRVRSAGADEVIDHTTTEVTAAVGEPVDVLLNLARITPEELVALVALVRPGGVVVNMVPMIPTPADDERGVRAVGVFVRSDAEQLSRLVELVDRGELRVDVAERVPLAELAAVHEGGHRRAARQGRRPPARRLSDVARRAIADRVRVLKSISAVLANGNLRPLANALGSRLESLSPGQSADRLADDGRPSYAGH